MPIVYVANWMTAIFKVRLPIDALAKETVEAMSVRLHNGF